MAIPAAARQARPVANPTPARSRTGLFSSTAGDKEKSAAARPVRRKKARRGLFSASQNEKIFFIDNLSTLLQAGMPLSVALATLQNEAKSRMMKKGITDVKLSVDNGGKLSDALREHPELFPPLYVAVVEVGEAGGTLSDVLVRLAETAKKAKALKSKMVSAMIYPIVVIIAIIIVVIILMIYVFPQLIAIFEEVAVELPIQTRILIGTVRFLENYGLYLLGGMIGGVIVLLLLGRIRKVKKSYHKVLMRFPLFGRVWREAVLVRILGNLRMLLVSGVPIVQAFMITSHTAGNLVYEDALRDVGRDLEVGLSIHEVLEKRPNLFTSLMTSMTRVGEETGKFDEILGKLESYYERRVENVFANLSSIIEPALLVIVGAVVGFIAVSVIMPIYNLAQSF